MNQDIIDIAEAMERVQDDRELLLELFDIFIEDFIAKRKELGALADAEDYREIKNLTHSLKGASGNISAHSIHRTCMLIEELCDEEKIPLIKELMQDLDQQFAELQGFVRQFKQKDSPQ